MQKIIYIKYDELMLKGNNVDFFKQKLISNISLAISSFNLKIINKYDFVILEPINNEKINYKLIISILKRVPGINSVFIAYKINRETNLVASLIIKLLENTKTFKIEVKRSDKSFEHNSNDYKRIIASIVLSNIKGIKVDVHNPESLVNIEIKKDYMIVYNKKYIGAKGLPVATSGRALALLSGGIDSPVASDILMRRGMHVDFITFITPPYTSEHVLNKIKQLVKLITLNYRLEKPKLYICNFTPIQNELTHIELESYRINLLRRSFIRIANKVAKYGNYDCLATGESLGQVASQTIESIQTINESSEKIILRPLIGFNKEDIIKHAKLIGTYNESIKPYEDSCSLFAPKNPVTKPKLNISLRLEEKIELLKELEDSIIKKIIVIEYEKNK